MHTVTSLLLFTAYTVFGHGTPVLPLELPALFTKKRIDIDIVKAVCDRMPGGCKETREEATVSRSVVKKALAQPRKNSKVKAKTEDEIEQYLNKIMDAKRAVLQLLHLDDLVEPDDNGLWRGDQLPSIAYLDRVIKGVDAEWNISIDDILPLPRHKRADGIALDYYTGNKWPTTTVNIYWDTNEFNAEEIAVVRAALKSIQDTTCITFKESSQTPYIEIMKTPSDTGASTCGWASLGYAGDVSDVFVNFASDLCQEGRQGVVVHEVLHVLGMSHEQNRYDRDDHITMDWNNVNPKSYDVYNHDNADDYNPLCIGYDYYSVMHYSPYVAVLDSSKPAFTATSDPDNTMPKIGTANVPSSHDIEWIKRHYCQSTSCKDSSPYCGWTACADCATYQQSCPHSCGTCPGSG